LYVKKELCILTKGGEWKSGIENLHIPSPDENIHAVCNFFTAKSAKVTQRAQRLILANLAESLRPLRFGKSCTSGNIKKKISCYEAGTCNENAHKRMAVMTQENDIVLIYFEDKPLTFARIEEISPDIKKDWYHVKMLVLQIPLQVVTWILRNAYINGDEFTMDGKRIRMERVVCPEEPKNPDMSEEKPQEEKPAGEGTAKVISLTNRKKN